MTFLPLELGSINIGGGPSDTKAVRQIREVVRRFGVCAIGETGDRDAMLEALDALPEIESVVAGAGGVEGRAHAAKVALCYDSRRFAYESARILQVGVTTYVGPKGAGASHTSPNRYVLVVTLRDLATGRRVIAYSVHLVASPQATEVRDELSEESVRILARDVRATRRRHPFAVIALLGDFNLTLTNPNLAPLRDEGGLVEVAEELYGAAKANTTRPTHGTRHIDHVWIRLRRFMRIVYDLVLPVNPRDHDAYGARIAVRMVRGWSRSPRRVRLPLDDVAGG